MYHIYFKNIIFQQELNTLDTVANNLKDNNRNFENENNKVYPHYKPYLYWLTLSLFINTKAPNYIICGKYKYKGQQYDLHGIYKF